MGVCARIFLFEKEKQRLKYLIKICCNNNNTVLTNYLYYEYRCDKIPSEIVNLIKISLLYILSCDLRKCG